MWAGRVLAVEEAPEGRDHLVEVAVTIDERIIDAAAVRVDRDHNRLSVWTSVWRGVDAAPHSPCSVQHTQPSREFGGRGGSASRRDIGAPDER